MKGTPILAVAKYALTLRQGLAGSQTKKDSPFNPADTKWFQLRLYDQQDLVIARIRRRSDKLTLKLAAR